MKVLLLDAGNSRLKWALVDSVVTSDLQMTGVCSYHDSGFPAQLQTAWRALPRVDKVLLGCVAGSAIIATINDAVNQRWGLAAEVLVSESTFGGIINAYAQPHQLGVDRWLAMLGGWRMLTEPAPMWIVDCGTAVTVDHVSADGHHQGGLILPGLMLMQQRLTTAAAALNGNEGAGRDLPESLPGLATDTGSALMNGALFSLVASVDRICASDDRGVRIITGGDGAIIKPYLHGRWLSCPHLVLQGMAVYAEECA